MRTINRVILHCTATPPSMDIGVKQVDEWHKAKGWDGCGYHFVIRLNGEIEYGRPIDKFGAHVKGHNSDSIGVAYVGGVNEEHDPEDTMYDCQETSFVDLYISLCTVLGPLSLHGHNEFANKACPSFRVKDKFPDLCSTS